MKLNEIKIYQIANPADTGGKMVHFRTLADDQDKEDLIDVEDDVRGDSIFLDRVDFVDPAPSKEVLNLKKTAQSCTHIQLMEQKDQDNERH